MTETQGIPALPSPLSEQAYCDVSPLEGGLFLMPCNIVLTGVADDEKHEAPALAFLLTHVPSGRRLLFDLGVCKMVAESPTVTPALKRRLVSGFHVRVPQDVTASLMAGGLTPEDITHICISHIHFDHAGNPANFPNAQFIVGDETRALLESGYPKDPNSDFLSTLLPKDRTAFLDTKGADWKPIGPFPRALDYFNDGSLYIVDAPGHLPGHVNILVRTSSDGGWIYLAGDSAHDWRLIRGEADIAVLYDPTHGEICMHRDKEQAAETIRRIADLTKLPRVRVILAHDNEWYGKNKGGEAFWPGKVDSL